MGKVHFSRDRSMLQNSPLILKQIRFKKNKHQVQKSNKTATKKNKNVQKIIRKKQPLKRKLSASSFSGSDEDNGSKRLKPTLKDNLTKNVSKPLEDTTSGRFSLTNELSHIKLEEGELIFKSTYNQEDDLFLADESKCNCEPYKLNDLLFQIIDEICLEGLDGITLEALWKRLQFFYELPIILHDIGQNVIWKILCCNESLQFFELNQPRPELRMYDRDKHFDVSSGAEYEVDIYPFSMIFHPELRGSCKNFESRIDISASVRRMNYNDVMEQYGNKLVIVGSQELRDNALLFELSDRNCVITNFEYCLLERIGRSRKYGEATQGKMSLHETCGGDAKMYFHNRKILKKFGFITQQSYFIKGANQNILGRLLHLNRFQTKKKNRLLSIMERIFETIKFKPQCRMDILEFREIFGYSSTVTRLIKSPEFLKFVRTDERCPYREIYPQATEREWRQKNKKERKLRMLQVIDPSANIQALWDRRDSSDEDSSDDEFIANRAIFCDMSHDLFKVILSKGREGISSRGLKKIYNMEFYTLRAMLKNLQHKNVIDSVKCNNGRQIYAKYFARCYNDQNLDTVDITPKPMKLNNSVLDKLREKQRNAIKNSNQPVSVASLDCVNLISENPKKFIYIPLTNFHVFHCINYRKPIEDNVKVEEIPATININIPIMLFKPIFQFLSTKIEVIEANWENIRSYNESDFYSPRKISNSIKVLLLKLFLDNLKQLKDINISSSCSLSQTQELNDIKVSAFDNVSNPKDILLGSEPQIIIEEVDEKQVKTILIESTKPQSIQKAGTMYTTRNIDVTKRTIDRANIILNIVYKEKVFENLVKLTKEIEKQELKEGYLEKMDRRSFLRIVSLLVKEGYIKAFKLMIISGENSRYQYFFSDINVQHDHSIITATKEQFKMKMITHDAAKVDETNQKSNSVTALSTTDFEFPYSDKILTNLKYDRNVGKSYGYRPKCIRMQILHEFLFYLIYEHNNDNKYSLKDSEELLNSYHIEITDSSFVDFPDLHCKEISWKMFIPPLPRHKGWSTGWALVCDVIYRLPLSVFVKIFNVSYIFPEMHNYLNHPVKRHYLIKYLPPVIQNVLLHKRKHLFSIHGTLTRLCYIGLLQFGPQKFKEKDQVFIYLNRNASLIDTRKSKPNYHKISSQEYEILKFNFNSINELEDYWCHVWTISMNTSLGQRNIAAGKCITIEDADSKPELIETLTPRDSEIAVLLDCGEIPGDKLGACGLDSALWFHLKRNWLWTTHLQIKPSETPFMAGLKEEHLNHVLVKPIGFDKLTLSALQEKVYLPKKNKEQIKKTAKFAKSTSIPLGKKSVTKKVPGKKKKVIRKILKRKPKIREYYDIIDRNIITTVGIKFRSVWSQDEDQILRYAKAASNFLCPNVKKLFVPYITIRDVLHRLCPESKNKTSKSCQRRIKYLLSSEKDAKNIENNSHNFIHLEVCKKYFNKIRYLQTHTQTKLTDLNINIAFIYFMFYLAQHSNHIEMVLQGHKVTLDYFSPWHISKYRSRLHEIEDTYKYTNIPESIDDVRKEVVKSIIHSSLGYKTGEASWSYQIFRIYQKFPDYLIRNAVASLKNQQLISIKVKSKQKNHNLNHVPFQLSNLYIYMLSSTFTTVTAYVAFKKLQGTIKTHLENKTVQPSSDKRYGTLLTYNEISTYWSGIKFTFEIPDMVVELNPEIADHTEVIKELAIRYEVLLKDKKESESNLENFNIMKINYDYTNYTGDCVSLNQVKEVTLKFIDNLPVSCKEVIKHNYIKMMEDTNNEEINHYFNMIMSEIRQISTQFAITKEFCDSNFIGYMNRLFKLFQESVISNLTPTENKIATSNCIFIINSFFVKSISSDDQSDVEKNVPILLNIIKSWINFVNKKTTTKNVNKFSCNHHFCYIKPTAIDASLSTSKNNTTHDLIKTNECNSEDEFNEKLTIIDQSNIENNSKESDLLIPVEQDKPIPTLEQIMQEMMDKHDKNSEKREVPYITDLTTLLSKERFPELQTDDETMENLRRHFITRFPKLQNMQITNINEFLEQDHIKKVLDPQRKSVALQRIEDYTIIQASMEDKLEESLIEQGGSETDFILARHIISYVFQKEHIGCTNKELKEKFDSKPTDLPLHKIIDIVVKCRIFLRAGISCITFVHHKHQSKWLVETFLLSQYEKEKLTNFSKDELKEEIEKGIRPSNEFEVRVMPWTKVDGTLNQPLFEKWLCTILSHCLDHPSLPFTGLINRFSFLTPVDMYYMLEILEILGSVELLVFEHKITDLFSPDYIVDKRPVTCLDNFEDVYVECNSTSVLCVGSFLDRDDIEFI